MRIHALLPLVLLAAPVHAQLVVGNDQSGVATFYEIDVGSGIATPIYSTTINNEKPWGMAYDAATNTLYWHSGTLLSSPYANPLVPTTLGTMSYNAGVVAFNSLSFKNGKLYATRNNGTEGIYEVDPVTLVATLVYAYPTAYDFAGLKHDAFTGRLYGLTDFGGAGLYEIDLVGMTEVFKAAYPGGETDIDGLAVANGLAYYITDAPGSFYVYDVATGLQTGTLPSPFTGSGLFCAGTWVGPTTTGTAYCFGDGSGTPCPCTPVPLIGDADKGCPNMPFPGGGKLTASGVASIMADTLVMTCTTINNGGAVVFQGTAAIAGGQAFGDGLRCVGGSQKRMKSHPVVGNTHKYPDPLFGDNPISIRGAVLLPGDRWYQGWYRSSIPHCDPAANFNFTNGVKITWAP